MQLDWSMFLWGWFFCGIMFVIGKTINHQDVTINLRKVLNVSAGAATIVPIFLVGIPYLFVHFIYLFTDWRKLLGILFDDLSFLPYYIGLFILFRYTTKADK
jgi:hypothetical protein